MSIRDPALFRLSRAQGHKQITDVYLLGLCQKHGGTLVTLDKRISPTLIENPHKYLVRVL